MTNQRISTKKLRAIVFTDIVNFTQISAEDEQHAVDLIDKQNKIIKPIVEKHNGEWLKEIGDGLLLSFDSSIEAVRCSIEIQESLKNVDELSIRIGIHQGDIIIKDGDVFGDDVNIASRIESFAPIGGISMSDKVHKDISGVSDIKTSFIGHRKLKGVKQETKIRCITSNNLPKHRKQILPLLVGYFSLFIGIGASLLMFISLGIGIVLAISTGAQINGDITVFLIYGCTMLVIGLSNLMYVRGVSIKSQRLILYLSYFIFMIWILKKTILSDYFFTDGPGTLIVQEKIENGYFYMNDYMRIEVDKAIEHGIIEPEDTLKLEEGIDRILFDERD